MKKIKKINNIDNEINKFLKEKNIDISKYSFKEEKEKYCEVCGEIISFISDKGYETARDCKCMREYRVKARLKKFKKYSVIERNHGQDIFSNVDKSILNLKEIEIYKIAYGYCKKFAENLKVGGGFLFQGMAGSGKTFISNCICNELEKRGYSIMSLTLSDYFKILRENPQGEDKFLVAIKEVDMLFIDDVGSEQINRKDGSNWGEEKIYNLFNARNTVKKPIIITTNLNSAELKNHLRFGNTDKIYSRLKQMLQLIELNFNDKRLKKTFEIIY